jgi:hypothetical protein
MTRLTIVGTTNLMALLFRPKPSREHGTFLKTLPIQTNQRRGNVARKRGGLRASKNMHLAPAMLQGAAELLNSVVESGKT